MLICMIDTHAHAHAHVYMYMYTVYCTFIVLYCIVFLFLACMKKKYTPVSINHLQSLYLNIITHFIYICTHEYINIYVYSLKYTFGLYPNLFYLILYKYGIQYVFERRSFFLRQLKVC